jgi:hypothetical protein
LTTAISFDFPSSFLSLVIHLDRDRTFSGTFDNLPIVAMFLTAFLFSFSWSSQAISTINTYDLVPGNWTEMVDQVSVVHPLTLLEHKSFSGQPNISTFTGEYNGIDVIITVTSSTTGNASYGPLTLDFEFIDEDEGIAISEVDVSDGSHLSILAYNDCTISLSLFVKDYDELLTISLFKYRRRQSSQWAALIPVGITFIIIYALKRYYPGIFG